MAEKPKPKVPDKTDDKEQSERFMDTARQHDTDETGETFERAFKTAVPARSSSQQEPRKKRTSD